MRQQMSKSYMTSPLASSPAHRKPQQQLAQRSIHVERTSLNQSIAAAVIAATLVKLATSKTVSVLISGALSS